MNPDFLASPQSSTPELAGVRTAILGSLWMIALTMLVAFPMGVGAAIYLEEYAARQRWLNRVIQTNINNLAGRAVDHLRHAGAGDLCARRLSR